MPGMTKAGYVPPAPSREPQTPKSTKKKNGKKKRRRINPAVAASLAVFAVAFVIAAGTLHVFAKVEKFSNVFSLGQLLDGHPIGGMTASEGAALLDELTTEKVASWRFDITCQGRSYALTASDVGLFIDKQATLEPLWQTGKTGSMLERYLEMLRVQAEHPNAKPVFKYAMEPVDALLERIKSETDCESVDATVSYTPGSSEPFRFTDEQTGYQLDTAPLREQIEQSILSLTAGSAQALPEAIEPKVTRAALENGITLRARVTMTLESDAAALENVRIAAGVLNGRRIESGDSFSFNDAVGRRTAEGGYQSAPEPAYGLGAVGVGGGICQVSSALYQAALLGGIEVVERSAAIRPVAYCDMGQEAAVSDQGIDLVLRNPTATPLFLTTRVYQTEEKDVLEVQIIGLPLGVRYALSSSVRETGLIEEPVYMQDKTGTYATYTDERIPGSKAQPGYSVTVERITLGGDGEAMTAEVISQDLYEAVAPVIYVGVTPRE